MPDRIKELKDWRFAVDAENIAWAVFDRESEKMNTLGVRPTEELRQIVGAAEELALRGDIIGLVFISAKDSNFIAGADIREFEQIDSEKQARDVVSSVIHLFDRIERLRVPVVAAIHGYCLGGGLEFALACHYRIADREEGTRLGFPEVKLGLIPGLHGSVRSIHKAGPVAAMTAMLTGGMLRASVAKAQGFVDELVDTRHSLRWAARRAVLAKKRSRPLPLTQRLLLASPVRGLLAARMRRQTAAKVRADHYPAPFRLIELFAAHGHDIKAMRTGETDVFAPLMVSDTSRNLRRVFRLSELLKAEASDRKFAPQRVHVIGAGTMGGDIAAWCVVSGLEVSLQDTKAEQIETARERARGLFKKRLKTRIAVDAAMERLIADPQGRHIGRADVVIEAIVEVLEIKQKVLVGVEAELKPGAVLATNTSSLRLEDIAAGLAEPGRFIGLHFFNPVAQMPLVEVIVGKQSAPEAVAKGAAFVARIGKSPLRVRSAPGFLVNRVLAPYMMAAISRLQDGMRGELIDAAALDFGMPMGPIELCDVVGLDIVQHVGHILGIAPPGGGILDELVAKGQLGRKSGRGFYAWKGGKAVKRKVDAEPAELQRISSELIRPLVEESRKALADGIVASADLIDAGIIFGTGFAPFRGGPLHHDKQQPAGARPTEAVSSSTGGTS
jgi:3-hydroxyacyl-CoA dehydrogenase/enoyl-CoA hydratase/3-hydroxybutyryl-CoA epimerase